MTTAEPFPLPEDRRPKAPPNHPGTEGDGPPEAAGARYAEGELLQWPAGGDALTGRGQPGARTSLEETPLTLRRNQRRHREATRRQRKRSHRIVVLFDDSEFEDLSRAAGASGLTESGWAADAALAAARSQPAPDTGMSRQILLEMMAARTQVRRVGVNLNQAVAALNATGEPPLWLSSAVDMAERTVRRLDEAATALAHRSGQPRRKGKRSTQGG
jgi:hypothetical protein